MITLVSWLWQGLAIALAMTAVLGCARRLNAATRHLVWCLTCGAVVLLPAVRAWMTRGAGSLRGTVAADAPFVLPAPPDWLLTVAALAWILFMLGGFARIAASLYSVARLKSAGEPVGPATAARLPLWRAAQRAGRRPELRIWDGAKSACALGLGRAVILVSRSLVETLSDDELDAIVMHEHAHLDRRDDRWQLLQAVVTAVAGWHPAVWFIGRRIHLEREAACDDHVVARTNAARTYARALVQAAAAQGIAPRVARLAIPGAVESASVLRRRVRRLLDPSLDRDPKPAPRASAFSVAVLAVVVASVGRLPAIVAFVEAEASLPRVEHSRMSDLNVPVIGTVGASVAAVAPRTVAQIDRLQVFGPADAVAEPRPVPASIVASVVEVSKEDAPVHAQVELAPLQSSPLVATDVRVPARPLATPTLRWSAFARAAARAGDRASLAGTTAGESAREAGLSLGRVFTQTGKSVAGRF